MVCLAQRGTIPDPFFLWIKACFIVVLFTLQKMLSHTWKIIKYTNDSYLLFTSKLNVKRKWKLIVIGGIEGLLGHWRANLLVRWASCSFLSHNFFTCLFELWSSFIIHTYTHVDIWSFLSSFYHTIALFCPSVDLSLVFFFRHKVLLLIKKYTHTYRYCQCKKKKSNVQIGRISYSNSFDLKKLNEYTNWYSKL